MKSIRTDAKRVIAKYGSLILLSICLFDVASSLTLWRLERSFVRSIHSSIDISGSAVSQVQEATRMVHAISKSRIGILGRGELPFWLCPSLTPTLAMGLFGEGACGYISFLEIEVLKAMDFDARPVQILGEDGFNSHVIVRATKGGETIFVDPLFNWVYLNVRGEPATQSELESTWSTLAESAPLDGILQYPIEYGIRYTNWDALGKLGPIVKSAMKFVCGEEYTDAFSFRAFAPNFYLLRTIFFSIICILAIGISRKVLE